MPELPEAETIARGLAPSLRGRRVIDVDIVHDDLLPQGASLFRSRVLERVFTDVGRRGKNVVLHLDGAAEPDDPDAAAVVLVNLGMTGKLLPDPPDEGDGRSTHPAIVFHLDDGGRLVYDDVRRFGRVECLDGPTWRDRSDGLGWEPLDDGFGPDELAAALNGTRTPIRNALLDQSRVAGVGNIYASEALHRAGIHPRRRARTLERAELDRLHGAIREVLREAIDAGGTTIRDYRNAAGESGRYRSGLRVYDREGEPCVGCGAEVRRIVFTNRSAFLCTTCQPESKRKGDEA